MINPRLYELNDDWHLSLFRNDEGWLATFACPTDLTTFDVQVSEESMLALEPVSFPEILLTCSFCMAHGRIVDGMWVTE